MKSRLLLAVGIMVIAGAACSPPPPTALNDIAGTADSAETLTIVADDTPIAFTHYQVNEARFNPGVENPAALTIMASLTFHNTSGERLEVRHPRFSMTINGVDWGELASTDFQIGRMQPDATQTIELQSLLLTRRMTEAQAPVVQAIQQGEPVTLVVSGTILVFPGGEETMLNVTVTLADTRLPGEWGAE